jgi:hypothetical protein
MAKVPNDLRKSLYDYMKKPEEQTSEDLLKSVFRKGKSVSTQSNLKK